jgi:succinyl-diaminopimelate desuccinylase
VTLPPADARADDDRPDLVASPRRPPVPLPDLATVDVVELARALCDVPSVSGDEAVLADAVAEALKGCAHLEVLRDGNAVVARTNLGRAQRVVVAGHLDTVPIKDNVPAEVRDDDGETVLWGRGSVDMKGGVAVQLVLAATLIAPSVDVTWVFYDQEEIDAHLNGLGRLVRTHADWIAADFAVLCEPTSGAIEGGCNGTLRVEVRVPGQAAHTARAWKGVNAIHETSHVLNRLSWYEPAQVDVDGLRYREGLSAVAVRGGIANNVVPDECVVTVNYRFAPSKSVADAEAHVREVFAGYGVVVTDSAPGARPGLDHPIARSFADTVARATGTGPGPKYGWTDVARFAELGVPAVNFGPGDPSLAHADDERCPTAQIGLCARLLAEWLS